MKNQRYCFFILILFFPFSVYCQNEEEIKEPEGEFLYLFDGRLIREGEYMVEGPKYRMHYKYNGEDIFRTDIKYMKNGNGYFGNYKSQSIFGKDQFRFIKRKEVGIYDIFEAAHYVGGETYRASGGGIKNSPIQKKVSYYYSKGFGELKKADHKNLKADLGIFPNNDFPDIEKSILTYIKKGKRRKNSKTITLVTGMGIFLVGLVMSADAEQSSGTSSTDYRKGVAVSGAGLLCSISSFLIPKPEKQYLKALRAYNGTY